MEKIDIGWNVTFPAVKTFLPRSACSGLPLRGEDSRNIKIGEILFHTDDRPDLRVVART